MIVFCQTTASIDSSLLFNFLKYNLFYFLNFFKKRFVSLGLETVYVSCVDNEIDIPLVFVAVIGKSLNRKLM